MPAAAPPPTSPAAPPAAAGNPTATPPPPPSPIPNGPSEPAVPSSGSAREKMLQDLWKKAGAVRPAEPQEKKVEAPKSIADPEADPEEPGLEDEAAPAPETPEKPAVETKPNVPPEKGKKPSPWKLLEQYKERLLKAETELVEHKKGSIPHAESKAIREQLEAAQKRVNEYEERIRFTDYQSSQEFQEQYQKPYEAAWSRAMGELRELTVEDPTTNQHRPVNADDILQLVNMPLARAREVADQVFGPFADDVMAHRKEIRGLYEKQANALEEAKKTGLARQKELQERVAAAQQKLSESVKTQWETVNKSIVEDPAYGNYFKPVDGDTDGNDRLSKGYALVDKAFNENPMNPKLSDEERSAIIKRHAAVRNRAAAFGRLVTQNKALKAELDAIKSELESYQKSEPKTGEDTKPPGQSSAPTSKMEGLFSELRKRAH